MKKSLRAALVFCLSFFCPLAALQAQNITVVPNPSQPNPFIYTGTGALSGYSGNPIVLNNSLVLEYNPSGTSDQNQIVQQLAVYTGGDSLKLIPNPDAGQGVYLNSVQIVFNNNSFFHYGKTYTEI